jgi:hypothetical protein
MLADLDMIWVALRLMPRTNLLVQIDLTGANEKQGMETLTKENVQRRKNHYATKAEDVFHFRISAKMNLGIPNA